MAVEQPTVRPAHSAAEISAVAELGDKAKGLLRPEASPPAYLALLIENGEFADAVRFLAHALPKREAVWWAWFCARRAAGPEPAPDIKAALSATENWIVQPTDENRRSAMKAAEKATFGTPAGCAGLGAFFSGGSVAPPEAPPNPPGEFMTAKAVAGAVMLAAVATEPETAPDKYRAFLAQGVEITRKIKLWDRSA
jgi:Family of unknown function (DUF6931)